MAGRWGRAGIGTAAVLALVGGIQAQSTEFTPLWTHASGSEGWIAKELSLGNDGTEAFTQLDSYDQFTRLFAGGEAAAGSPLWQTVDPMPSFRYRVASARRVSLHATVRDSAIPGTPGAYSLLLRVHRSSSTSPVWSWTAPVTTDGHDFFQLLVNDDGSKIVFAVWDVATAHTRVFVFPAGGSAPESEASIETYGPASAAHLSADGGELSLASAAALTLVRLTSGAVEGQQFFTTAGCYGHALSSDGRKCAFGAQGLLRAFTRSASGSWSLAFQTALDPQSIGNQLAFSRDGRRLAFTETAIDGSNRVRLRELDVTGTSPTSVLDTLVTSGGTLPNGAKSLALSRDGAVAVVGLAGDAGGPAPEIEVFTGTSGVATRTYQLPGSVGHVELSDDGHRLAVASKLAHDTQWAGGGRIDYFDLGARDIVCSDVAHLGATVHVTLTTPGPHQACKLLFASGLADPPRAMGPLGALFVDRTTIFAASAESISDSAGHATFDVPLAGVGLGQSLYVQGVSLGARKLTDGWIKLTVVH